MESIERVIEQTKKNTAKDIKDMCRRIIHDSNDWRKIADEIEQKYGVDTIDIIQQELNKINNPAPKHPNVNDDQPDFGR